MQVKDIMTKDVSYASPATNAAAAAELMWTGNCGSLPVVADGGHVVGIITDRDLFIALGTQNRKPAEMTVNEIMHPNPAVCHPTDSLKRVLHTMANHHVHRLPVVESGVLQGVVSIHDFLLKTDSALKDEVLQTMKALSQPQQHEQG